MKKLIVITAVVAMFFALPFVAKAGSPMGTFCWQLNPYIDVICFDLESRNWNFHGSGYEHAAGLYKVPLNGNLVIDDIAGVLRFTWAYRNSMTGSMWDSAAHVSLPSLNGTWVDDMGRTGDFTFIGSGPVSVEGGGQPADPQAK